MINEKSHISWHTTEDTDFDLYLTYYPSIDLMQFDLINVTESIGTCSNIDKATAILIRDRMNEFIEHKEG